MVLQSSMGQFKLDVRYGDRNTIPYYNGALDSGLLGRANVDREATAGKVYTLATNGALTVGLTDEGIVPYFGWSGLDENNSPDVERNRGMPGFLDKPADETVDGDSIEGIGGPGSPGFHGIANRGIGDNIAGGFATIQHIAAVELATTAFAADNTQNSFNTLAGTTGVATTDYTPGTTLTAIATGSGGTSTDTPAGVGLLVPTQAATDVVVGHVGPAGVFMGPEGFLTLAFTPAFISGTTVVRLAGGSLTSGARDVGPLA